MDSRPVFLILPGVTADAERFRACIALAHGLWPEARVEMPDYLSRFHGVEGVGKWLDPWASASLDNAGAVYVLAYILGGAALAHAPVLLSRTRRVVLVRSRYQEAVPKALVRRFTYPGALLLFGKAIADLGARPFWPAGFKPSCPVLTLVETLPSRRAEQLKVRPLSDAELGISEYREVAVDHDGAYHSRALMTAAVSWLRPG